MKAILAAILCFSAAAFSAQQPVNVGTAPNDGTGDPARTAFQKLNANDAEEYNSIAALSTQIGSTFNVRDATYGAKGDGVTDDTAAIQAAAAAVASAGGGALFFPPGNYVISNTTVLSSGTGVVGYGATITPKASPGWAGSVNQVSFSLATSATNITIRGIYFAYTSAASGGCQAVQLGATNSHILVEGNTSNYCGDFVANIGATDVKMLNNTCLNSTNACYDNWYGANDVTIANNYCSLKSTSSGRCVEITGFDTNNVGTLTAGFTVTGNTFVLTGAGQQGVDIQGNSTCATPATNDHIIVANNRIKVNSGVAAAYPILARFCSNDIEIAGNDITSLDSTDHTVQAIGAFSIATNARIHNNNIHNWVNSNTGGNRGAVGNSTPGGSANFNECDGCTLSGTLTQSIIGATDTTTQLFGNDTGSGAISATLGTLTISPGTAISRATWGTAGLALVGSAFTANDTTTGSAGVSSEVGYNLASPTFTNTEGTANTLSNAVTLRVAPPVCGGGWLTCTNLYSIDATGRVAFVLGADITGASVNVNSSSNFATSIGTGTSAGTVTLGGTTVGNVVNLASVSTRVGNVLYASATAPTITSGFNTSGSSITASSTAAFKVVVGTSTGTSTGVLAMPTASNGWACNVHNTTNSATSMVEQSAFTTASVTVTNYVRTTGVAGNFTNSDVLVFTCGAF